MPPLYGTLMSSIGALLTTAMSFLSKPFQCDHLLYNNNVDDMQNNRFAPCSKGFVFV